MRTYRLKTKEELLTTGWTDFGGGFIKNHCPTFISAMFSCVPPSNDEIENGYEAFYSELNVWHWHSEMFINCGAGIGQSSKGDNIVEHPSHYQFEGGHEPIDVIASWGLGFNLGNTVKYISRAGRKGSDTALTDLEKAAFYLAYEIKSRKEKQ